MCAALVARVVLSFLASAVLLVGIVGASSMGRLQDSEKSMSSPINRSPPAAMEISNTEEKSRKRRKRRKVKWRGASDVDIEWAKSLSEPQLDLMVSIKQLAMERVRSTREKPLKGLLTPTGLRTIGIILEEFMMDRVQTLRGAPSGHSSVTDNLRACIEKSEVESNETSHMETTKEPAEASVQCADPVVDVVSRSL